MNLTTSAYGSARAGLRDVEARAAPAAEKRIVDLSKVIDELLRCSGHGEFIDCASRLETTTVERFHLDADRLLAQRFGHLAGPPLERAALNVVLVSRLLRCLQPGRSSSDAVVFANTVLHMNALAGRRRGESQGFQTAVYKVDQGFVGENANLGAMSILIGEGGVSSGGPSILKVDLRGAQTHPLYWHGKPPRAGMDQPEALHTLSERLMLGMLVADDALDGAAHQHRSVLNHYVVPGLPSSVMSGLSEVTRCGARTLWGVMIRNQSDPSRQAANTTPRQLARMIDAIARVVLSRSTGPGTAGTAGIVFFGDRLPAELQRVARACLKQLPVFCLTELWREKWGDGKGLALDLRGQAVLYASLVQQHGLVAIVGNKSGGLDLPAHVGVPTVQVGPLSEGSDPLANRIGLLSLVSDSWSLVPAPADAATPPESGAADPACEAIAACLDRAWQRHPPR